MLLLAMSFVYILESYKHCKRLVTYMYLHRIFYIIFYLLTYFSNVFFIYIVFVRAGYMGFENDCYKIVVDKKMNWTSAEFTCEIENGHLADVLNHREQGKFLALHWV